MGIWRWMGCLIFGVDWGGDVEINFIYWIMFVFEDVELEWVNSSVDDWVKWGEL